MTTWLITGASSGLGAALARAVLEQSDNAVITARNTDHLTEITDRYHVFNLRRCKPAKVERGHDRSISRSSTSAAARAHTAAPGSFGCSSGQCRSTGGGTSVSDDQLPHCSSSPRERYLLGGTRISTVQPIGRADRWCDAGTSRVAYPSSVV